MKAAMMAHPEKKTIKNTWVLQAKLGVAHTTIKCHLVQIGKMKKIQKWI